jgi:hypothetical protein
MSPSLPSLDVRHGVFCNTESLGYFYPIAAGSRKQLSYFPDIIMGQDSGGRAREPNAIGMNLVFAVRDPLQVFRAIVGFISVYVIHLRFIFGIGDKSARNQTVHFTIDALAKRKVKVSVSVKSRLQYPDALKLSPSVAVNDGPYASFAGNFVSRKIFNTHPCFFTHGVT